MAVADGDLAIQQLRRDDPSLLLVVGRQPLLVTAGGQVDEWGQDVNAVGVERRARLMAVIGGGWLQAISKVR